MKFPDFVVVRAGAAVDERLFCGDVKSFPCLIGVLIGQVFQDVVFGFKDYFRAECSVFCFVFDVGD